MSETARSTDSMQVSLSIPWEIEVYHDIDREDIDTSGEDVRADQATRFSIFEVVINPELKIRLAKNETKSTYLFLSFYYIFE